jgi:3-hydroxy-3-methylglutaryl CoA synthase
LTALGSIVGFGAYVPRLRLSRATIATAMGWLSARNKARAAGGRSICNWDEDAITLAVEAARSAAIGPRDQRIDALALASTTLPFADRDGAALVASALDLSEHIETLNFASSLRAGTNALANALRRADTRTFVIASDARKTRPGSPQELTYGHGAAALLVCGSSAELPLATVLAIEQVAADFVDHYRAAGESFDYRLEERWVRDEGYGKLVAGANSRALQTADVRAADVRHLAMPGSPDVVKRIVQSTQLTSAKPSDTLHANCGDTGAAQPLLLLADIFERAQPGEHIVVVGFGQGVDVLVLRTEAALKDLQHRPVQQTLARGIEEQSYVRYLSNAGLLDVDFGMRAERDNRTAHTVAWRKHRALTAFVGGQCTKCGTVQFPPSHVCVNPECRATDSQKDHPLAESVGRVKSFTEDWQAYSPRPPCMYANIEFAEGGNLLMELTDLEAGTLAVGDTVRFTFRVKDLDRQRAFRRYFWKATKE